MFDDNDGFYVGFEEEDFCIHKKRVGIAEQVNIDITKVFEDGTFDPTLGNVYRISFGYLGFATIHFEVMTPGGNWVSMGEFKYPNTSTVTHIKQTNLPARAEVTNSGNNTNLEFRTGSFTFGIVDGGGTDPSARIFTDSNVLIPVTAGIDEIITVRNKTTFNSIENRIKLTLLLLSISTELNRPVSWAIIKNATFTNTPTFTDFNTENSVVEISNDATINPLTGTTQLAWNMAKEESFFEQISVTYSIYSFIRISMIFPLSSSETGWGKLTFIVCFLFYFLRFYLLNNLMLIQCHQDKLFETLWQPQDEMILGSGIATINFPPPF